MKKRVGLVLLLLAVVAVMAFAATRIRFTANIGNDYEQAPIRVNWVETSKLLGNTTVYINYTVMSDVESMLLCCKVTSPTPKFGAWNRFDNTEALITKGKTYTANMGSTTLNVSAVEVWLEKVKMK